MDTMMTIRHFPLQYRHVHQTMQQEIERQEARLLGIGGTCRVHSKND